MDVRFILAKLLKKALNPPALRNCKLGEGSWVGSFSELSGVEIGRWSIVGNRCFATRAAIGSFCQIADGCWIGGAAHPIDRVSLCSAFHSGKNILRKNFAQFPPVPTPLTIIESDVWLGMGCRIKSGVKIGVGAVVGMGSVVTKDVPPYEIWAGAPAKKIRDRFEPELAAKLLETQWWLWDDEKIQEYAELFDNPQLFVQKVL